MKRVTTNVLLSREDDVVFCGTQSGDILECTLDRANFKRAHPNKRSFPLGVTCTAMLPNGDILVGTGEGTLARLMAGINSEILPKLKSVTILLVRTADS